MPNLAPCSQDISDKFDLLDDVSVRMLQELAKDPCCACSLGYLAGVMGVKNWKELKERADAMLESDFLEHSGIGANSKYEAYHIAE